MNKTWIIFFGIYIISVLFLFQLIISYSTQRDELLREVMVMKEERAKEDTSELETLKGVNDRMATLETTLKESIDSMLVKNQRTGVVKDESEVEVGFFQKELLEKDKKIQSQDQTINDLKAQLTTVTAKLSEEESLDEKHGTVTHEFIHNSLPFWAQFGVKEIENNCDNDYGFSLIDRWKHAKTVYCSPNDKTFVSEIDCYRVFQTRHTAKDNYCIGHNVIVDLSKFKHSGEWGLVASGGIKGACDPVNEFAHPPGDLFQQSLRPMMTSFLKTPASQISTKTCSSIPTGFVYRDGVRNVWHSLADMISFFMSLLIADLHPKAVALVITDDYEEGPFDEMWTYLAQKGVHRLHKMKKEELCFNQAIFSIPGGSCPIWKDVWRPNDCSDSGLIQAFSRFILNSMGILSKPPPNRPIITFSIRTIDPRKQDPLGRMFDNDKELIQIVKDKYAQDFDIKVIDLGTIPFKEQIELIHSTSIYIGMHGAGMTHILYLPPEAVVIEMFPQGWHQDSMRNMAKWTNHAYFGWQNHSPENHIHRDGHVYTRIDINEFERMLYAAVHLSKSFGVGSGNMREPTG